MIKLIIVFFRMAKIAASILLAGIELGEAMC